ncbi:hypothetical protein OG762_25715 [Streptomyces sp. NBC_01136]|nr:hypothetical protein OG762_25715 [Streptomyces sp. NBC_01136]
MPAGRSPQAWAGSWVVSGIWSGIWSGISAGVPGHPADGRADEPLP